MRCPIRVTLGYPQAPELLSYLRTGERVTV
jgi:hypothetical protein